MVQIKGTISSASGEICREPGKEATLNTALCSLGNALVEIESVLGLQVPWSGSDVGVEPISPLDKVNGLVESTRMMCEMASEILKRIYILKERIG